MGFKRKSCPSVQCAIKDATRNKSIAKLYYHTQSLGPQYSGVRWDKGINRWKRTHCRVTPRIIWRTLNEDADLRSDEKDFSKRITVTKLFSLQF